MLNLSDRVKQARATAVLNDIDSGAGPGKSAYAWRASSTVAHSRGRYAVRRAQRVDHPGRSLRHGG